MLIGKWTASDATFEGGEEYNYVFNSSVQQNYLANSGYLVIKGKLIIDSNLSSQDYNDSSVSTLPNLSCDAAKIRRLFADNLNTYSNSMYSLTVGTTLCVGDPGSATKTGMLDLSNAGTIRFNQDINVHNSPFVLNSEFETLKGTVDDIKANYEALTQEQEASPSDLRLKNVIGDSKYGLNELRQISVKDYIFKKDDKKTLHTGVVAQELREVFPNLVEQDKEGYLFIKPMELLYVAINAIKQIDIELKQLKESFGEKSDKETLEAENQKMKKEIKRLKKENEKIVRRLEKIEQYMKQ